MNRSTKSNQAVVKNPPASVRPQSDKRKRDRERLAAAGEAFAKRHAELLTLLAK